MVLVIDKHKNPQNPCRPAEARILLKGGKAAVFRQFPFTIILADIPNSKMEPLRLKIDPGSVTTGMSIVNDQTGMVICGLEIIHRGKQITKSLSARSSSRSSRRYRKNRYRKPRFDNRKPKIGWLPPSIESRIAQTETWIRRLIRHCPIRSISIEIAKFDTQLMQNAEISGVEYQQGMLQGYEVREYLLEKYNRTCSYCLKKNLPLEIDHIIPKSRGGSDRVSNLTISCKPCNRKKNNKTAIEFGYPDVQKNVRHPLKDSAIMNTIKSILLKRLDEYRLPIETATGALTKFHRIKKGLDKAHWIDATCVGVSTPETLVMKNLQPLIAKSTGHGSRQMCRVDQYGFPRTRSKQNKKQFGFQTGDIVKAKVNEGKRMGTHFGKVAVRSSGYFDIDTFHGKAAGIKYSSCKIMHRADGYNYSFLPLIREMKKAQRD